MTVSDSINIRTSFSAIYDICGVPAPRNKFACNFLAKGPDAEFSKRLDFICSRKQMINNSDEFFVLCNKVNESYAKSIWTFLKENVCKGPLEKTSNMCKTVYSYMGSPENLQKKIRSLCQKWGKYDSQLNNICKINSMGTGLDLEIKKANSSLNLIRKKRDQNSEYIVLLEQANIDQSRQIEENQRLIQSLQEQINSLTSSNSTQSIIADLTFQLSEKQKILEKTTSDNTDLKTEKNSMLEEYRTLELKVSDLEANISILLKERSDIVKKAKSSVSSGNKVNFSHMFVLCLVITSFFIKIFNT